MSLPGKTIKNLLLLGDERLYEVSSPVEESDYEKLPEWIAILDGIMSEIREKYGFGRAIAAPQAGIMKRIIYMKYPQPRVFINPEITEADNEMIEMWDDCMSLPNLLVRVKRHRRIKISYSDENRKVHHAEYTDDMSELFQHEYDHLDGILCTMRAIDSKSFMWRETGSGNSL